MNRFNDAATRRSMLRRSAAKLSALFIGGQAIAAGGRPAGAAAGAAAALTGQAGAIQAGAAGTGAGGDVDLLEVVPGAHHQAIRRGSSREDMSGHLAQALAMLGSRGGTLRVPAGTYRLNETVVLPPRVRIMGSGRRASVFEIGHDGDAFRSTSPINSFTEVNLAVEGVGIACLDNRASRGAGFRDVGGTYVDLRNVWISGFRHGCVLDQTEIGTLDLCQLEYSREACLWLVNGGDVNPAARTTYTNRIGVTRCQINQSDGWGVVDDGGRAHSFRDNNFNACRRGQLRIAGYGEYVVDGNYFEEAGATPILVSNQTLGGRNVQRPNSVLLSGNLVIAKNGLSAIAVEGATALTLTGNTLVGAGAPSIRGANTVESLVSGGNAVQNPAGLFDDSRAHRRQQSADLVRDRYERVRIATVSPRSWTSLRVETPEARPGDMALASFEPALALRAAMPVVEAGAVRIDLENPGDRPSAPIECLVRVKLMKA